MLRQRAGRPEALRYRPGPDTVSFDEATSRQSDPPWQGGGKMIADVTLYQGPPNKFEATVRPSFAFYKTFDEIDVFIDAVRGIDEGSAK